MHAKSACARFDSWHGFSEQRTVKVGNIKGCQADDLNDMGYCMHILIHIIFLFIIANCGIPIPPQDGYLDAFTSTLEGAEINITCSSNILYQEKITCEYDRRWHPNSTDICISALGMHNLISKSQLL